MTTDDEQGVKIEAVVKPPPGDVFADNIVLPEGSVPITLNGGRTIGHSTVRFDPATGEYLATGVITDPDVAAAYGVTAGEHFSIPTEITTEETP